MRPDADTIARAIVAACIETGDAPLVVASETYQTYHKISSTGKTLGGRQHWAARYYAYHALVAEFPGDPRHRARLARRVGAPRPVVFQAAESMHRKTLDLDKLARVCAAVRGEVDLVALWRDLGSRPVSADVELGRRIRLERAAASASSHKILPFCLPREPVVVGNLTAEFFGDPLPGRSALVGAKPWVPYEERARQRSWRSVTCSSTQPKGD